MFTTFDKLLKTNYNWVTSDGMIKYKLSKKVSEKYNCDVRASLRTCNSFLPVSIQ